MITKTGRILIEEASVGIDGFTLDAQGAVEYGEDDVKLEVFEWAIARCMDEIEKIKSKQAGPATPTDKAICEFCIAVNPTDACLDTEKHYCPNRDGLKQVLSGIISKEFANAIYVPAYLPRPDVAGKTPFYGANVYSDKTWDHVKGFLNVMELSVTDEFGGKVEA